MSKKSIGEIRRAELAQATFSALVKYGIRGTSLDRIAKIAGVSKGVVLHHYKDKDGLFEAVQRQANTVLRECVVELLFHAETPIERLYAVVVGNFAYPVFQQEICHAWISLCADVPHNKQSQRIKSVVHKRTHSNLLSALRHMSNAQTASQQAFQIVTMMDGLWLRAGLQEKAMTSTQGIAQMDFFLRQLLAPIDVSDFDAARQKMENLAEIILKTRAFRARAMTG